MQRYIDTNDVCLITPTAQMSAQTHGGRAKCLQRLIRLDMPVPTTVALSIDAVAGIVAGQGLDVSRILEAFSNQPLLSVRPSSESPDWGGPGAILNIGMNTARHEALTKSHGRTAANALYLRFITAYAVHVARLDPDEFLLPEAPTDKAVADLLAVYEFEAEEPFPQDPARQLADVLRSMARAWEGTTARLLRQAKGAPADAGLGLVVQEMALGVGAGESGSGVIQFIDPDTAAPQITGRYLSQSQGRDALGDGSDALYLTKDPRGRSLEEQAPKAFEALVQFGAIARKRLREEMQIEFTLEDGTLRILDAIKVVRASRADVRIAVSLATDGVISKEEALLRIPPSALSELLHRQVARNAVRDVIASGIAASPGAAYGRLVFTSADAQAYAAREEPCILVRRETGPDDIRGMHAAQGVITQRGGITSHAAVIGRGLGLPCVVGASKINVDARARTLCGEKGRIWREGDMVTIDGTSGNVLKGEVRMVAAGLDEYVSQLLTWADEVRDIGIRANADTPTDALTAKRFKAEGIGLCRTEHMFFEPGRLNVMREMIFSDDPADRAAALKRLLPMQRADFVKVFRIMEGQPVCIRLLDPPLHEFLPQDKAGLRDMAEALGQPMADVTDRVAQLSEFNPMLGLRGVRLAVTMPEIYAMQARAIFEAVLETSSTVVPEIMIPLVSAKKEVELARIHIDAAAAAVRAETGQSFDYAIGVMVETPRAALRAGEIAPHTSFLSFGTNDLTQLTYGLSRDDAGRFMSEYVQQEVFAEDPFLRLDLDGVGELVHLGAQRARAAKPNVKISLCGEHGGHPEAIRFCREIGFDYISCSPFRVPVARLAAAQVALRTSQVPSPRLDRQEMGQ